MNFNFHTGQLSSNNDLEISVGGIWLKIHRGDLLDVYLPPPNLFGHILDTFEEIEIFMIFYHFDAQTLWFD